MTARLIELPRRRDRPAPDRRGHAADLLHVPAHGHPLAAGSRAARRGWRAGHHIRRPSSRHVPGDVHVPGLALARGPQPVRVAAVVFTCVVIATYISANRRTLPCLEENGADRGLIIMLGWLGVMLVAADGIANMDRLKTLLGRVSSAPRPWPPGHNAVLHGPERRAVHRIPGPDRPDALHRPAHPGSAQPPVGDGYRPDRTGCRAGGMPADRGPPGPVRAGRARGCAGGLQVAMIGTRCP